MYRFVNQLFAWVNTYSPVIVQTPNYRSFGNCAEHMFYGLLQAQREGKRAWFVYPRPLFGRGFTVANTELLDLESPWMVPHTRWYTAAAGIALTGYMLLLAAVYELRRRLGAPEDRGYAVPQIGRAELWKPRFAASYSWDAAASLAWGEQYRGYQPPTQRRQRREEAEQRRVEMGLPLDAWFVCLHVSENTPRMPRNASIGNYTEAIEAITAAGGWVVRLGDAGMTPLPSMARVIDYPFTRFKSALMDVYLIEQCRFLLGLTSGPNVLATLFRRPMVLVNTTEWTLSFPVNDGDLVLTRHIYSREKHRYLSVQEMLQEPFSVQVYGTVAPQYEIEENTPAEIREVVEEFLAEPRPSQPNPAQRRFSAARTAQIRRWLDQGEPRSWQGVAAHEVVVHQYRAAALAEGAGATLGRHYLEENWDADALGPVTPAAVRSPSA